MLTLVMGPAVSALSWQDYFSHQGTWQYLLHNAKLFPDVVHRPPGVFLDNPRAGGVNGSLWTLPVEVRMYLIVAVLGTVFYINAKHIPIKLVGLAGLSAVMGMLYYGQIRGTVFNVIYALWFSYLVLYIAFHPRLKLPDLGKYGDFSYGLYLYAFPATQIGILWLGPDDPWRILALGFTITLLLAMFSWFVVEKPSLKLKGRLLKAAG